MNLKFLTYVLIGATLLLTLSVLATGYFSNHPSSVNNKIVCTLEAKLCPDGSYVGRTGPNCEFAACPAPIPPPPATSGITGKVLLGPTCPVERIPPDPACADKPYSSNFIVVPTLNPNAIVEFKSDAEGRFTLTLTPGDYIIKPLKGTNILPVCRDSETITVVANQYANVTIDCDTGIR